MEKGVFIFLNTTKFMTHHSCIYEVVSEGVSAEIDNLQDMPASESKWWSEQILSGKPIILNTLEQLSRRGSPDEYQILVVQGIQIVNGDSFDDRRPRLGIYGD